VCAARIELVLDKLAHHVARVTTCDEFFDDAGRNARFEASGEDRGLPS
jgi:hypothetical protein